MERIKQQVDQLQQQLAGLTVSQKMLVGTLVAVMVVTVIWWTRYAATGEFVALLEQPMTSEQVGEIRQHLAGAGIEFEIVGDAVLVHSSKQAEALSILSFNRALPADTTQHFDKALGSMGSFDSRQKLDLTVLTARQNALASDIGRWPGVRDAKVHVNPTYKRQIGGDVLPSAGVTLTTSGNADVDQLAVSASAYVASAFPMLRASAVEIIVDGRQIESNDDSVIGGGNDVLELRANAEQHFERNLRNALSYIPGIYISVHVDVDAAETKRIADTVDPESKIVAPLETRSDRDASTESGGADWGEAGFVPNTGLALNANGGEGGGGPTSTNDIETEETRNLVEFSRERVESHRRAAKIAPVSCTLSLPRSYVLNDWQSWNNVTDRPTLDVLRAHEQQLRQTLTDIARKTLGNMAAEAVTVVTYSDAPGGNTPGTGPAVATTGEGEGGTSVGRLVSDYGKPAAVVALAAVALFLVSSTMKKSGTLAASNVSSTPINDLSELDPEIMKLVRGEMGGSSTPEAGGVDPSLMAQEIAEDQLQAGQMAEQVQSLVKENPDAAAALVKRWLSAG